MQNQIKVRGAREHNLKDINVEIPIDKLTVIAVKLKVSEYLVGFVIMAVATSIPELIVGILAALENDPNLSLGNVIGSNIANMSFILGLAALIASTGLTPVVASAPCSALHTEKAPVVLVPWIACVGRSPIAALTALTIASPRASPSTDGPGEVRA